MDDTSHGDHQRVNGTTHYTEVHEKQGCDLCELKKTGRPSIEDTLLKVALLQSQRDELVRLYEQLAGYVNELTLSEYLNAIDLLVGFDHVALAGLVRHFMVNAMNMSMGGDD